MVHPFRTFYEDHVRFVWRSLLRLGVPEQDVPDAVQDVFVVAHRKLPEFEGRSKTTTWLFAICVRIASTRRRTALRLREVPGIEPALVADPTHDEAATLERRRALEILDTILGRMPDAQRSVFILFELEQMTADEIAEALDVPVGTVRSRLRLARAAFRQAIARLRTSDRGSAARALTAMEALR